MPPTPTTTRYRMLVRLDPGDTIYPGTDHEHVIRETLWEPLGVTEAIGQEAAMEAALLAAKAKRTTTPSELDAPDASVDLTVAVVSERNWGEGTAIVELRSITIWKKGE